MYLKSGQWFGSVVVKEKQHAQDLERRGKNLLHDGEQNSWKALWKPTGKVLLRDWESHQSSRQLQLTGLDCQRCWNSFQWTTVNSPSYPARISLIYSTKDSMQQLAWKISIWPYSFQTNAQIVTWRQRSATWWLPTGALRAGAQPGWGSKRKNVPPINPIILSEISPKCQQSAARMHHTAGAAMTEARC